MSELEQLRNACDQLARAGIDVGAVLANVSGFAEQMKAIEKALGIYGRLEDFVVTVRLPGGGTEGRRIVRFVGGWS